MAEYIEREAVLSELQEEIEFETSMYTEEQNKYFNMGLKCAIRDAKSQPAADVVEVIRCKNCKNYELMKSNGKHFCNEFGGFVTEEDFCSRGERKESDINARR